MDENPFDALPEAVAAMDKLAELTLTEVGAPTHTPQSIAEYHRVPQSTAEYRRVPQSTAEYRRVPQSTAEYRGR